MKWLVVIKPKLAINNTKLIDEIKIVCSRLKPEHVSVYKIYSFHGEISQRWLIHITKTLLVDTVVEDFVVLSKAKKTTSNETIVNIWYKPEVLDVEALYVLKAIKYVGFNRSLEVHSGKQIRILPKVNEEDVKNIIEKIFANPLIQYYEII